MTAKRKITTSLLLTACLIVCIKLFVPAPFKNRELKKEFWVGKTHTPQTFPVIAGGDSRVYRGFATEIFEEQTSTRAHNLGYSSAGWSSEYLQFLISKVDTSAAEPTIILGLSPHSFTKRGAKNEHYNTFATLSDFEIFRGTVLSKHLKHFSPFKPEELVKGIFGIEKKSTYFEDFRPGGWVHSHKVPEDSTSAIPSYQKTFRDNHVDSAVISNFVQTVDKLVKRDLRIIIYRSPTTDQMEAIEDSMSGFNETRLKAQLVAVGAEWIDFNNNEYRSYDGSHLHYEAAIQLTEALSKHYLRIE